jgi:hypothetical protein
MKIFFGVSFLARITWKKNCQAVMKNKRAGNKMISTSLNREETLKFAKNVTIIQGFILSCKMVLSAALK